MSKNIKILGIAGSLRKESFNRSLLRSAAENAPEGVEIEIYELEDLPGFNQDKEKDPPAKAAELKEMVRNADAILFVTPEF